MDFSNIPESLKEKAVACKTPEELLALAKQEGIELTDEQLEGIVGGKKDWTGSPIKKCPDCGSKNVEKFQSGSFGQLFKCNNCGVIWEP